MTVHKINTQKYIIFHILAKIIFIKWYLFTITSKSNNYQGINLTKYISNLLENLKTSLENFKEDYIHEETYRSYGLETPSCIYSNFLPIDL